METQERRGPALATVRQEKGVSKMTEGPHVGWWGGVALWGTLLRLSVAGGSWLVADK